MKKITSKFMALLLSLLTVMGTMTTPAFAAEDLVPGGPGALTERYIDESTSRELAPPTTSKSSWVKDAPAIAGYEFESFSQTTDHIYSQEEINFIVGYPDKTVRGDRSLSRCEAVTIFSRLYNGVYPEAKQHLTEKTFSDVPAGVWYYDKLSVCYNAGILSWCGDGKFQPYAAITRAEFAAMAAAFAELPQAENAPFSDVDRSYWAYDDINSAAEAGWIVGYPDGTFRPESEISRAETVTLINRLRNRKITAEELRALGVKNPYKDLSESYWAYGELIEATVKHNAADWHKLNYNEENLNTVVERFVDSEGSQIAEPITTKGQTARAPRDFKNRNYLGYTTEITYVYRQGQAVMTGSKEVDKAEAKVGDTLHYTVTVGNNKSAAGTLRNAVVSDTLSQHLGFVYGSVLVDGENTRYSFDVKTGLLSVNVGDIAPGENRKVSFAAIVKDTAYGETLSNTAILGADNSEDVPVTDSSTKVEDGKPGLTSKKSVDKAKAKVGDTLTYTVTAKNAEDATAPLKNATLTDALPNFVDFVQGSVMVDGASGRYRFEKGALTVELGEIAPGAEKAVTFQVKVNSTAYGQAFQNTAVLGAENSDPVVPSDEGVTVEDGAAKISAVKSVDKAKARVGDTLTYTITASNADTATVPLRNVVMSDTLPKYVTFNQGSVAVDGSPVRTTFNSKTRQLTAELGDIAPGQSKVLTFSALVNNTAYGKKFSNTAILSADNSQDISATDTGVTVAAGVPEGSSGAKTVSKSKANVGDTLTYSIALRNASTATADWKNVKVTDAIPEHLAFVPGSVEVDGRSSNDYSYNADTRTLTLIADKISIGKTLTYTFRVTVEDGAQGQYIVNTAKVTSPDREDMQFPDTGVEISGGQTEPMMTKTASVKKAKPGDTFTYTVEVKNGAKATADWKNVVLSDVLPVGVELVGGTVAIDDTTTEYTLAGQVLEVKLGNLKPNESVRVTFEVKVLERAAEDIIRNVATAQGDNGKRTASDNGVEVGLGKGELSGTKTVSQTTAKVGDILTYTITARNSDEVTSNLKDVIVTDTLSEYLTLNPGSVQVDGLPARHFFDGAARQLRVELVDIAPGQMKTITFTAAVNSNAYGKKFGNTAVITAKNGGPVTVTTPSDVTVTDGKAEGSVSAKTVDKSKAKVGDTLTYSIAVRNASTASGPWKNVEVVDVIPKHLSFVSGSVEVNGRSTNDFSYNASSRTLKLLADSVESGQTKTFSFRVTVDEGAQGMYITNTAIVKSPDREDIQLPDTGVTIDGGKTAPSLTKTASKAEVKPGDIFTYTIKVKNGANATADWKNVTVSDIIPAGLEFVSGSVRVDGQAIAYGISGRALEIPVGDLNPNREAVVEFEVRVLDSAEGTTITNTAREAGRSPIKEHHSGAFAPKEKPVRGPSAIKSRRAEESVKAVGNPIKAGKPGAFEKRPGRPGPGNIPQRKAITSGRKRAGKALMERAARKMKLHSQKQLAQRAGHTAKAAGSATKKLAAVTVRAARALVSAIAGIVGGTGVFMLLAVVLLGGALSAFGSSPGTGIYTPVSAEVEAFDPIIRIYATQHGIPEYVDLIKAVMMQESGGNVELVGGDVMQCAEGMGLPVGTPVDPEKSIDFGTSIIASNLQLAGATGPGDIPHISLALQGYNFGNGYISWALARGGYSKENAREFSVWQAGIHGWSGYGDINYVDHVLRYYPLAANPLGGASAIAEDRFAFPFPGHTWDTYPGHNGIDISFANCYGEPVYACAPGTVRYIQDGWTPANGVDGMWSFGNCVVVDHTDGWQSVYAHLSRLAVTPGTPIRQGQLVGYIGSTGNSTGPHLHLALYYHGSPGENGMNYAEMAWPQYRE